MIIMGTVSISNARPVLGISRDISAADAGALILAWQRSEAPAAVAVYYRMQADGRGAGRRMAADYGLSTSTVSRLSTAGGLMVRVGATLTEAEAGRIVTAVNYRAHKGIDATLSGRALMRALDVAAKAAWEAMAAAADPALDADDDDDAAVAPESAPESAPAAVAAPEPVTPEALVAEAIRLLRKADRAGHVMDPRQAEALVQVSIALADRARKAAEATA